MMPFPWNSRIVIMGAGDRGTATALRLFHSGFMPVLVERGQPSDLHFIRNFSDVIYCQRKTVEDVQAAVILPAGSDQILHEQLQECSINRIIPVINTLDTVDQQILKRLRPDILVDCTRSFSKTKKMDLPWSEFPCVIRIGFIYNVGEDGHYVIGDSQQYYGMVFNSRHQIVPEYPAADNVLKSPLQGVFQTEKRIGAEVQERETIGLINNINIMAPHKGYITGLLHSGHFVLAGQPLFELISYQKPRESLVTLPANCRAIAGGILETILKYLSTNI
jgi:xanthine dehydrogenase accessory factor